MTRMIMKSKICLLLCMSLLSLFAACTQNDEPIAPEVGSKTVLVYMVADNNLFPFAEKDMAEMLEGMKNVSLPSCNLLVYCDGNGNDGTPTLFRIGKDKKGKVKRVVLKEYAEQMSTDASVMKEVIHRAFFEYPADGYGLVYWSHADGWVPYPVPSSSSRWIGQDTGGAGDGRRYMNISDFVDVLDDGMPHFDFIMFDACFMMSAEVAYEVRGHTDYYMASPTEIPGPGAPYDKIVPFMFRKEAAPQMAKAYFNGYKEKYNGGIGIADDNWTGGTSICVLKTGALEELAMETRKALSEIGDEQDVALLREQVFDYDMRRLSSYEGARKSHIGYYDFPQMMKTLLNDDAYMAWKQLYDASVAYWETTEKNYSQFYYEGNRFVGMFSMEGSNGLSHYIPLSVTSAAAEAYRSLEWYRAAGLDKLGW